MAFVTVPTAGQYGLVVDQAAQELPVNAWSRVRNMRFRGGKSERVGGHASIFTAPSVTPYFVYPYQTQTKRYWVHAGTAAVYVDDGTSRSNITGTAPTGTSSDRWTGAVLNGVLLINNGVDSPMYWGGTGTLAAMPGWNATWKCGSIGAYKVYSVAWGITKSGTYYPHMVKWSHAADPGSVPSSWDETDETKDAGEQDLAETTDLAVDQLPLGDANILYKERSMYAMRYIGGTQIFEFRRIPGSYGMLAKGCAAVTPKGHVVLANGDIVLHDGVSEPQSLITDRLKNWLFSTQIDSASYQKCFVVSNPSKAEVWICYPEVGETTCTQALIWNWDTNTWGLRDLPNVTHAASGVIDYSVSGSWSADTETWAEDSTLWNQDEYTPADSRLLMASTAPGIYMADAGSSFAGTSVTAVLERTGLAFDEPERLKLIRRLMPRFESTTGATLYITFGASMDAETAPTWGDRIPYVVGSTIKADGFANGRFLAIRIESEGGPRWAMKSYTADIVPGSLF